MNIIQIVSMCDAPAKNIRLRLRDAWKNPHKWPFLNLFLSGRNPFFSVNSGKVGKERSTLEVLLRRGMKNSSVVAVSPTMLHSW